jgi:6-phosphogluconolactonase (cycloisomerase 2 family)
MRRAARVGAFLALALTGCPDGGVKATAAYISFTPATLPNGAAGVAYAQVLTPSGGQPPYAWTLASGTLPAGISFSAVTGTVSGTPQAGGTSGTFTVRLTDAQPVRGSFERTYTLTIPALPGLGFTPTTLPDGAVAAAYAQTFTPSGGLAPYTWALTAGTPPPGLGFNAGTVSGTPTSGGSSGTFTIRLTDAQIPAAFVDRDYTVSIPPIPAPAIAPASLPDGAVAVAYSQTLTPSGGLAPYTWALQAGSLPPGLAFNAGTISGTPTSGGSSGTFTIRLTDAQIPAVFAERQYTISIPPLPPPAMAPASLPDGALAVAYSQSLTPSGGLAPYTWAVVAGALPSGVSFNAGTFSGTPAASGLSTFTLRLTDAQIPAVFTDQIYTINVLPPPPLVYGPATLPDGAVGIPYGKTFAPSGGLPPYMWSLLSGTPPAGLTFNATDGRIAGTPTTPGSSGFTIRLTDSQGTPEIVDRAYTIQITQFPAVVITCSSQYTAVQNWPFSKSLSVSGGVAPYVWSLAGGSLPAGLSLSPAGVISGTPSTLGGPVVLQVQAVDSQLPAVQSTKTISITVTAAVTRFAYVLNMQSATISIYAVDATTGALRHQGFHGPMDQCSDLKLSADGRFLYVSSTGNSRVISFAVDQASGQLTQVDLSTVGSGPAAILPHPTANLLFTPDFTSNVVSAVPLDPATGDLGTATSTAVPGGPRNILLSPSGTRLYVLCGQASELRTYGINLATGALTLEATIGTASGPITLALSSGGEHLYVANQGGVGPRELRTYSVTAGTEVPVFQGTTDAGSQAFAIRPHPNGSIVYVADTPGDIIRVFSRNPATGLLTQTGSVATGDGPIDLVVDPSGSALWTTNYVSNDVSIFSLDGAGALTSRGTVQARLDPIKMALLPGPPASFHPRMAYVSDEAANVVRSYAIDDATGQLTGVGSAPTGPNPRVPAIHPRGTFLYTPDFNALTISGFSIAPGTGALTSIGNQPSATSTYDLEIDPSGRYAYSVGLGDNQVRSYSLNPATGAFSITGSTAGGNNLHRALVDPTGQFLYVNRFSNTSIRSFRIDYFTGVPTVGGLASAGTGPFGGAAHPSGRFIYVSNKTSQDVTVHGIAVDIGDLTSPLQTIAAPPLPGPVAVDPKGRFLYVTNETGSSVTGFTISSTTGLLTSIGVAACGAGPVGLDVDPSGRFLYVACTTSATIDLFSIHPTTGALTPVDSVAGGTSPAWVKILGSLD